MSVRKREKRVHNKPWEILVDLTEGGRVRKNGRNASGRLRRVLWDLREVIGASCDALRSKAKWSKLVFVDQEESFWT